MRKSEAGVMGGRRNGLSDNTPWMEYSFALDTPFFDCTLRRWHLFSDFPPNIEQTTDPCLSEKQQ